MDTPKNSNMTTKRIDPVLSTIEVYNKNPEQFIAKWNQCFLDKEYSLFKNYLDGKKILDVGCGHGRDAAKFSAEGYDITGIDLSESLLERAIQTAPKSKFLKMDMRNIQFPSESFDGIWCNSSLLHIPKNETGKVFAGFASILRCSGILFITVKEGDGESTDPNGRFYSYYKEDELKEIIETIRPIRMKVINIEKALSNNENWINAFAMKTNL